MLPLSWEAQTLQSPEVAVWNRSRGRPDLRSSPGSASSRVQVTGVPFKCINTKEKKKIKKTWPGLLNSSQASEASFAQDLPISVSCFDQGNTQGTHTGLAKVTWRSAVNPVVCKSHPKTEQGYSSKKAWPLIGTVQSQPSDHQTSDLAEEHTPIPKHPCITHFHRTAMKSRQYHQAAVSAASTKEPLFLPGSPWPKLGCSLPNWEHFQVVGWTILDLALLLGTVV